MLLQDALFETALDRIYYLVIIFRCSLKNSKFQTLQEMKGEI